MAPSYVAVRSVSYESPFVPSVNLTLPTPAGGVAGPFTKSTDPVEGAPQVSWTVAQPSMFAGETVTVAAPAVAAPTAKTAATTARTANGRLFMPNLPFVSTSNTRV